MGRLRRLAIARQSSILLIGLVETRRREEEKARKLSTLESLLRNWQSWTAVYEDRGLDTIIDSDGEEWNYHDMLKGIDKLSKRQQEAVWKILIEDKRPVDAAREMFAGSKRIVGEMAVQHKEDALIKLLAWHEQKEEA